MSCIEYTLQVPHIESAMEKGEKVMIRRTLYRHIYPHSHVVKGVDMPPLILERIFASSSQPSNNSKRSGTSHPTHPHTSSHLPISTPRRSRGTTPQNCPSTTRSGPRPRQRRRGRTNRASQTPRGRTNRTSQTTHRTAGCPSSIRSNTDHTPGTIYCTARYPRSLTDDTARYPRSLTDNAARRTRGTGGEGGGG